jgi:uncharacterized phiE125 gp8 family phage protein
MNITVTVPPPFEPVTLAEVWAHLRLDPEGSPAVHPDDAMLERMIATARDQVEKMTRRSLIQQTLQLSCRNFKQPADMLWSLSWSQRVAATQKVLLRRGPIIRVESVSYYDAANALQTLDSGVYYVTDEQVPELCLTVSAPSTYDRPDAVRVSYVAGYAPDGSPPTTQAEYAANVPKPLKDAILVGVQMLYDSLTPAEHDRLDNLREALVQPFRVQHT